MPGMAPSRDPQPEHAKVPKDPLSITTRLVIDGSNLLHAIAKTAGAAPPAALIGRLRAAIPAPIAIEVVLDGPADPGLRNERIAAGVRVRHANRQTADAVILETVDAVRRDDGPAGTHEILVVTDDRDLRHGAQVRGARTASARWLLGRLEPGRLAAPSVGNRRPPRSPGAGDGAHDDEGDRDADRRGWRPGRGATVKKGNPRKAPRGGTGRMPG
jgi:YacP-like NYN domain-containing protein